MARYNGFVYKFCIWIVELVFTASGICLAQSNGMPATPPAAPAIPQMPQAPNVPAMNGSSGLEMPKISAPSFGESFYKPKVKRNSPSGANQTHIKNSDVNTKQETHATSAKNNDNSSIEDFISAARGLSSLQSTNFTRLSAADISKLGQSGLLNGIYGLDGVDAYLTSKDAFSTFQKNGDNSVILKKILEDLETLKSQQAALQEKADKIKAAKNGINNAKEDSIQAANNDSNNFMNTAEKSVKKDLEQSKEFYSSENGRPTIIRFTINGYNILGTCKTVYFSNKENDGSFLLTADRKYISENKLREETFYLLFRSNGNGGSAAGYNVEPAIIQDYENTYSFIYQMAQRKDLKATKTGNLVSLRYSSTNWNMDLLLDIGNDEVQE